MTMRIRFTASLITALVCVLFTEVNAAENFTLSDEGLMALHFGSFYATATPSILAKKDVPGPGVEY
jgi:hypothetical protein